MFCFVESAILRFSVTLSWSWHIARQHFFPNNKKLFLLLFLLTLLLLLLLKKKKGKGKERERERGKTRVERSDLVSSGKQNKLRK